MVTAEGVKEVKTLAGKYKVQMVEPNKIKIGNKLIELKLVQGSVTQ